MNKSLSLLLIGLIMIGVVAFSGCAGNADDTTANETSAEAVATGETSTDELVAAIGTHGGEPAAGFNPITGWGYNHEPLIQSTLFKKDSNANLINDLATNYTFSEDGLTWTVKIRNDVKFHDGVPLTAKDVAFTFNTAANASGQVDLSMLEKATALNNETVEFKLNDNQATFINKLTVIGIVPEHAYGENYGQNPIGSGPYKFVKWDKGQQVILEANPDYYGETPYFKKLTIVYMQADTAFAAAKSGQIDLAEIPSSYANQNVDGMKIVSLDSIDARGISFPMQANTGKKTENG